MGDAFILYEKTGRIVTVGSESYSSTLDFDNLQSEKKHQFLFAYFRSKLENILFTFELSFGETRMDAAEEEPP